MSSSESKKEVGFFQRLQRIDQKYIFLLLLLLIVVALIHPMGLPVAVSPTTRQLYDSIDRLPKGARVLFGSEMTAGQMPEYEPMNSAVVDHLFRKGTKIYFVTFQFFESPPLMKQVVFPQVDGGKLYGNKYGIDYVDFGYIPGGEAAMAKFASSIRSTTAADYLGTPLDSIPVMAGVDKLTDFDYIMVSGGSTPVYYIRQFQGRFPSIPMGLASPALFFASYLVYLDTGQVKGLLYGLIGGAEYEVLLNKFGPGIRYADVLTLTFTFIFGLIAVSNIGYLHERIVKKGQK